MECTLKDLAFLPGERIPDSKEGAFRVREILVTLERIRIVRKVFVMTVTCISCGIVSNLIARWRLMHVGSESHAKRATPPRHGQNEFGQNPSLGASQNCWLYRGVARMQTVVQH
jgi:hypothetical protein